MTKEQCVDAVVDMLNEEYLKWRKKYVNNNSEDLHFDVVLEIRDKTHNTTVDYIVGTLKKETEVILPMSSC